MAEPLPFVSDQDPDRGYERPIRSRYRDPVELIWIVTARRLGLTVRRNAEIYSATDGRGLLEHGPQETLDPDDSLAQMIFHELCHWITNGVESFHERDWGFPLDAELDWREHSGVRLQPRSGVLRPAARRPVRAARRLEARGGGGRPGS